MSDNPLCAECSPQGMIEEYAYWAWLEAAKSAGYIPGEEDDPDEDDLTDEDIAELRYYPQGR